MTQRIGSAASLRRIAALATAVLATTVLSAGCGTGDATEGTGAAPSPSADPKAALLAAVPDEKDPAFRFTTIEGADKFDGVVDPAARGLELSMSEKSKDPEFTMGMTFRVIDEDIWMRVKITGMAGLQDMMKLPKRWMLLDRTKLDDASDVPVYQNADPANMAAVIRTAETVEDRGDGTYAGFADLTANADIRESFTTVDVDALGDAAKKVPFTAVVGPDGNLTSLTLQMPAAGKKKAMKVVAKYYDFGKAPKISAPTGAQVQKAPATAYEMLNG
ncbi:hypothetical protein AB0F95_04885 [Micromonospora tulbaghiae]|uniref:Lipoprotein n=1 Tax=Micromonospora tulbaghiae TaxID=479978 RepID=A0ABY0KT23_9ACTN|nr:hypothetical protein [Micromonospora tulbaghiae]MDX5458932.1 hypothetical protein [Micromonospora tulbaghiae]SCF08309.1 hypothetical protein GA0070562_5961 [Micromonospora tulbaghiae]